MKIFLVTLVAVTLCLAQGAAVHDLPAPNGLSSRFRRQVDCRTCDRNTFTCSGVCQYYLNACLSGCDIIPSLYCKRDCYVKYSKA